MTDFRPDTAQVLFERHGRDGDTIATAGATFRQRGIVAPELNAASGGIAGLL